MKKSLLQLKNNQKNSNKNNSNSQLKKKVEKNRLGLKPNLIIQKVLFQLKEWELLQ